MKKLLVESISEKVTLLQKVDFEAVDEVFDALNFAFHPNGLGEEEPDDRFISLWKIFLSISGWSEDDYWMELEFRKEHCKCEKCREKEELEKANQEKGNTPPDQKSN